MIGWHVPEYQPGLPWWPLVVVIVAIVVINIVNNRLAPQSHYLLWSFASSVVLIAIGLLDGNSFTDMGLGWWFYLSGFIWAVASIGVVTAFYVVVSLFKKTRQACCIEKAALHSIENSLCILWYLPSRPICFEFAL